MKLLILTRSFDQRLGGMEAHTRWLAEHFLTNGWSVTIATPEIPASGVIFTLPQVSYIRLGAMPNNLLKYSVGFWLRIRRLLLNDADDYDVIINISMAIGGSFGLPRRTRAKIVSIAHGTYVLERRTLLAAIRNGDASLKTWLGLPYTYLFDFVQRGVIRRSARIVCVSENVHASLLKHFGADPRRLVLIRNFVNLERFKPHTYRQSNHYKLLFLSRLHAEKGLFVLLDALQAMQQEYSREFSQLTCYLAGDGPDAERAKQTADATGLDNVVFLGTVSREQIAKLMADCDLYVFPTLRLEGLPLSLLEAMAAGLPTIASDIEGPNEVIESEESGLLCPPGDATALLTAIMRLLGDVKLRQRLGRQARARIEQDFNARKQLSRIDAVLHGVGDRAEIRDREHTR
jgi:glycosyltransferase involved in cell wall biosynthesis